MNSGVGGRSCRGPQRLDLLEMQGEMWAAATAPPSQPPPGAARAAASLTA